MQAVYDVERAACSKLNQLEETVKKQQHGTNYNKELEMDLNNMVEILRRAREKGKWDASDMVFYYVNPDDILGPSTTIKQWVEHMQEMTGFIFINCDFNRKNCTTSDGDVEAVVDISLNLTPREENR